MVSVIKTTALERKARLYELHFEQPMVLQAPLVLTFCADSFRTRQRLTQRFVRQNFGNFIGYHVAAFDAIILAHTTALALQSHGLGITSLARYYTSDLKYAPQVFERDSEKLRALLEATVSYPERGFCSLAY